MFKIILTTLFLLLPAIAFASIKDDMLSPVIKIEMGAGATCSAISIGNNEFLSAAHCFSKATEAVYTEITRGKDGIAIIKQTQYQLTLVRKDIIHDIALLHLEYDGLIIPPVRLATSLPEEADDVWSVGYPAGFDRTITEGLYNKIEIQKFDGVNLVRRLRTSAPIFSGNSGGALFRKNGEHYELIGITVAVYSTASHLVVSVHLDDIKTFLNTK